MGHVNVDPQSLGDPDRWIHDSKHAQTVDKLLKVLIHEVMHVLGFTYEKIRWFPCPERPSFNRFGSDNLHPIACSAADSPDPVEARSRLVNGQTLTEQLVLTPTVVQMARAHYNCPQTARQLESGGEAARCELEANKDCMDGVPLENQGGRGTAASHWEKRVLNGDVMVGSYQSAQVNTVSDITLALFEDSGWYKPDYSVGAPWCFYDDTFCQAGGRARTPLLWGSRRGCSFVSGRCNEHSWQGDGYFCDVSGSPAEGCTLGRQALGFCTLSEAWNSLPPQFQYFANPRLGGKRMEDYCPIWQPYKDWDCRFLPSDPDNAAVIEGISEGRGERRCVNCRCFASSLVNSRRHAAEHAYFGCYEHRCVSATQLQLRIDNAWYDCLAQGDLITPSGWTGSLQCPDPAELCEEAVDLGWPSLVTISPSSGEHTGGTPVTISGKRLVDRMANGSLMLPRIFFCGKEALQVSYLNQTFAEGIDVFSAVAPVPPYVNTSCAAGGTETMIEHKRSCHVRVVKAGGQYGRALGGFRYINPNPQQPAIDTSCGWDISVASRVLLRTWPYVVTLIVLFTISKLGYDILKRKKSLARTHLNLLRCRRRGRTVEYSAQESL